MCSKPLQWLLASAIVLSVLSGLDSAIADTWHLTEAHDWENVSDKTDSKYMLTVAEFKRLIAAGDTDLARQSLVTLKQQFPEIVGPDLDVFMEAETLYAEGKWPKAVNKYDDLIETWPNSRLYESALQRQFSIAVAFLNGEKRKVLKVLKLSAYEEGAKIIRRIADRAGDASIAKRGLVTLAESYEKRAKFLDAYETWADISSRWPTADTGRQSLLGMARSLHLAYGGPKYDAASLLSAKSYYQNFKLRYPQLTNEHQIDEQITLINEQLAYKQFAIGWYYERTGSIHAANLYYQYVLDNWPDTTAAKMADAEIQADISRQTIPPDAKKPDLGRCMFDACNVVLDSWFGLKSTEPER